jgi:Tfp pilus assembly protein PilO
MTPLVLARELWQGHRPGVILVVALLAVNVGVLLGLQHVLVPTVDQREQLLIRRQAELRGGGGDSPALIYAQGVRDLAAFNERIPPHREFTGLINELHGLAGEAGLDLTQINYSQKEEPDDLLRYSVAFNVAGPYAGIKQFIHSVEQSPRLMLIEQIGLQGTGKDDGAEVRLQMNLVTFFRAGKG